MSISRIPSALFNSGVGAASGAIGASLLQALGFIPADCVGPVAYASGIGNGVLTLALGSTLSGYSLFASTVWPVAAKVLDDDTPMLKRLNNPLVPALGLAIREMLGSATGVAILLALSTSNVSFPVAIASAGVGGATVSCGIQLTVGLLISLGMNLVSVAQDAAAEAAYKTFKSLGGP